MKNYSFNIRTDYSDLPDHKDAKVLEEYYAWGEGLISAVAPMWHRINGPARMNFFNSFKSGKLLKYYEQWIVKKNNKFVFHRLDGPAEIIIGEEYGGHRLRFFIFDKLFSIEDYLNHPDVDVNFKLYYLNNLDEFNESFIKDLYSKWEDKNG